MNVQQLFMQRCFNLAQRGAGNVSPNPMVGAVLVHDNRIIGEGWHRQYGQAHAEVHCLDSVGAADRALIPHSTLYCSLEPCSHFGKTPPCADLIIREKIPEVVVCNTDPNPLVAGKGIERLRQAGIQVKSGILESDGLEINRFFFHWIGLKRPYVILKWAQSRDGFLGKMGERTIISGKEVQRMVHRWRYESDAILVGAETAKIDDPVLDTRYYQPKSLLRVLLDSKGSVPANSRLLSDELETLVFGVRRANMNPRKQFHPGNGNARPEEILEVLAQRNKAILLVEGGAMVLNQFIKSGLWDEIRLITGADMLKTGVLASKVPENARLMEKFKLGADEIALFRRP